MPTPRLDAAHRGPVEPLRSTPPRRPRSVRRTSTIDTRWPDGFGGGVVVLGRARDVRTPIDGSAEVVTDGALSVVVAADRTIVAIDGPTPALSRLVGVSTARGFRSAIAEALPDQERSASPLRLLLDDLPAALLVSGFALVEADALPAASPGAVEAQLDVCAGWGRGTAMVEVAREAARSPTPVSVPSPPLDDPLDHDAWHDAPLPEPIATRRRRLLDVAVDPNNDDAVRVESLFRDTHVGHDRIERSFHEYAVTALLERRTRTITAVRARPGVLPWATCPSALSSAARVVGTPVDEVRAQVRATFRGPSTCTHLNDVLAAIGDAAILLDLLPG